MALKIRLRQQGRKNRAFYRVVVTDSRYPRDGRYVEVLGWYNPIESELEKMLSLKPERIEHWLGVGAQLTERVEALIAKGAPDVITAHHKKELDQRAKEADKRKARSAAVRAQVKTQVKA
jgi:small subunit ribosomal protein S16